MNLFYFNWMLIPVEPGSDVSNFNVATPRTDDDIWRGNERVTEHDDLSAASLPADASPLGAAALNPGNEAHIGAAPAQLISFAIGDDQYGVDIWQSVRSRAGSTSRTCRGSRTTYAGCLICAASLCPSSTCAAGSARG